MQQFNGFYPGYDNQQQQQQQQQTNVQDQQQTQQQQQQQPMNMNGPNLAIYSPASMQPLSVLAAAQRKGQQHQQLQQQQQQPEQELAMVNDMGAHGKPKRKQVKNACVNCQKACKKCDIGRPCQRCIKYGLTETCINSVRKERKKGVKRGPYKKRNKSGGESNTSSGASTPNLTSPMANPNLYVQNNNARPNGGMPIHYQPFPQGHYDPYAYANSTQMMPQAYMVPAATIQQMYSTNPPVMSYMNMIQPQQTQQQQQQVGGYRIQEQLPANNSSATSTPTLSTATTSNATTATSATNVKGEETANTENDDDEGSKLNMLSQLCSAVLQRTDEPPKTQASELIKTEENTLQNTPPPSRPLSREPSQDTNNNNGPNFGNATFINQHLAQRTSNNNYGTPGSSPSDSHADALGNYNNNNKPIQENNHHQWSQPEQQQ